MGSARIEDDDHDLTGREGFKRGFRGNCKGHGATEGASEAAEMASEAAVNDSEGAGRDV